MVNLDFYSIWPSALVLMLLTALAGSPLMKAAESAPVPTPSRVETLDGLRGFLALAVFFHHGALYHTYILDGLWRPPANRFYALLGPLGVSVFFMITGFLFWSQVIEKRGRPDWLKLYIGRVFRIGPIYLLSTFVMVASVVVWSRFQLRVRPLTLITEVLDWSMLGLKSGAPINGFAKPGIFLAFVTWSLRWEWFFYLSLLVTSLWASNRLTAILLPLAGFISCMVFLLIEKPVDGPPSTLAFISLFSIGMLTAATRDAVRSIDFRTNTFSALTCALVLSVLCLFRTSYAGLPIVILGLAFFLIANGASLFGLLLTRSARRLGNISFGIYLLQGFAFAATFSSGYIRTRALSYPLVHWACVAVAAVLLLGIATLVHVIVERPGVDLGRIVARRLASWAKPASGRSAKP